MFSTYCAVEVFWVNTNPYLVWFHYSQHAGYPLSWFRNWHEHFTFNQLVQLFFDALSQGHWHLSRGMNTWWNVFVNNDLVLSWKGT